MKKISLLWIICLSISIIMPTISWADTTNKGTGKEENIEVFQQIGIKTHPDSGIDRSIFTRMDQRTSGKSTSSTSK